MLCRQLRPSDSRRVLIRFRTAGADLQGNHLHRERVVGSDKRLATTKMRLDFRWMNPIHRDGRKPHQRRVEDVQEHLVCHDVPIVAFYVLNHTDKRPDEDEYADHIEREHVLVPWRLLALSSRSLRSAHVEDNTCQDKEAEDNDLQT